MRFMKQRFKTAIKSNQIKKNFIVHKKHEACKASLNRWLENAWCKLRL